MTDFNTLVQDVYTITNRRDLVNETALAVKSATLQLHKQEFFFKDLAEFAIQYDSSAFLQAINYRTLFPLYRALKYLRKFDPNATSNTPGFDANGVGSLFTIISPDQILDSYSIQRNDVAYVAGDVIQVRSATEIEYSIIGIYQNPQIANTETQPYRSWIADEAPYAVVWQAAAILFGTVLGSNARQASCNAQAQLEFGEIRNSNIIATGE